MTGWRTALRLAWREAKRAKGRATLIIAMITLPVMALVFLAVNYDTFELSPDEKADRLMGTAQAAVTWPYDAPVRQEPDRLQAIAGEAAPSAEPTDAQLLALLPPGTRAMRDQTGSLTVHTVTGTGTVGARQLEYTDPLAQGILQPLSGRAPAAADEVALTPAASARLGSGIDGTVRLADGSRTLRVTAIVEDPSNLDATTIVLRPDTPTLQGGRPGVRWLVATPNPMTWSEVQQLNTHGLTAVSRQVLANPPDASELYQTGNSSSASDTGALALVAGLAVLEVVLMAGAAFAVSARRRRRDLALVAASGGTPAHIRRIVLADGVVLGVVAAVTGVGLGIASAAIGVPLIEEDLLRIRAGDFRVYPLALAVLAGVAVVTGMLAALVPAWIASRQDIVTALAGRRGVIRSRRRWVIVGLVLAVAGVGIAAVGVLQVDMTIILIGLIGAELALVLCTPSLVGLVSRIGRWLPPAPRIALRNTSRNRTAAAPAISAVMAAVIGSLVIGIVLDSEQERWRQSSSMRPGDVFIYSAQDPAGGQTVLPPQVASALRSTMPVDQIHEVGMLWCGSPRCSTDARVPAERICPYLPDKLGRDPNVSEQQAARSDSRCAGTRYDNKYLGVLSTSFAMTLVVGDSAAGAVSGIPAEDLDQVTAALRAGKVVVDEPDAVQNGTVTLAVKNIDTEGDFRTVTAPGIALPHRPKAAAVLMTKATAVSLGFETTAFGTLATMTRMPTVADEDRLRAALGNEFNLRIERGPAANDQALIVLTIVSGLITLGAAALATGLTAADGRADLGTLAAVGASPWLRRMLSLSQSGMIAGLGSLLGAVAGVGAAVAVLTALNQGYAGMWPVPALYPITVPWLNVAIAVVGVPLVAMLGAGLVTRSRLPIEHRL